MTAPSRLVSQRLVPPLSGTEDDKVFSRHSTLLPPTVSRTCDGLSLVCDTGARARVSWLCIACSFEGASVGGTPISLS